MKTIKEALELLDAQEAVIDAAREECERIMEEMIAKFCPVKPGDIVTANRYTHTGKNIKVGHIRVDRCITRSGDNIEFRAYGYVLRKDGTTGKHRASHIAKPVEGGAE